MQAGQAGCPAEVTTSGTAKRTAWCKASLRYCGLRSALLGAMVRISMARFTGAGSTVTVKNFQSGNLGISAPQVKRA